jgi:hypothetical protein
MENARRPTLAASRSAKSHTIGEAKIASPQTGAASRESRTATPKATPANAGVCSAAPTIAVAHAAACSTSRTRNGLTFPANRRASRAESCHISCGGISPYAWRPTTALVIDPPDTDEAVTTRRWSPASTR